jgi:WD40 repeat protein
VLRGHSDHVRCVIFHDNGDVLATGSGDGSARVWRLQGEGGGVSLTAQLHGHTACVNTLAFHPRAPVLATGSDDETAKLWRVDGGAAMCVATLHGNRNWVNGAASLQSSNNAVLCCAFHAVCDSVLATGCDDGTVKLWRLSADFTEATCVNTLKGHGSSIYSLAFHPHTGILITGSDDETARIWLLNRDCTSARCTATMQAHGGSVMCVAFHSRAAVAAIGSYGGSASVWQ